MDNLSRTETMSSGRDEAKSASVPDLTRTNDWQPGSAGTMEIARDESPDVERTTDGDGSGLGDARGPVAPEFPGYVVLGELGRGGMGVVYLARQRLLNRPCALKVILAGAHADAVAAVRFLGEAESIARLQHPNVVQIRHIGNAGGLPFLELEYVEGGSLDRRLDGTPWPPRRAAELVAALARGVAEAHRAGIVHRDLKPANVLLAADETPKVSDFGLAKQVDGGWGLTATESILGSPSYMAPEQAEGKNAEVGPSADVYALGAILYELLTGRPPFRGASILETLEQVRTADPASPSRLIPGLPADVETITLKCLQKEPARRYDSAAALSDDLARFLDGRPIVARPVGSVERVWRWARRNPALAGLGASVLILLTLMAAGASVMAVRFRGQLAAIELAERSRREALADAVLTALPDAVPLMVEDLRPAREFALPILRRAYQEAGADSDRRIRAAVVLTMLGEDLSLELVERVSMTPPAESRNVVQALAASRGDTVKALKEGFAAAGTPEVQARFATALLTLGQNEPARAMLALDEDQSDRAAFIHHFADWHGDLSGLADRLGASDNPAFRSGICIAVGRIAPGRLNASERRELEPILLRLHREAPDGGTHGAAGWALKRWGIEPPAIAPSQRAPAGRGWFVNGLGMTMVELPAGTMPTGRTAVLPIAMSMCELTNGQFRRFLDDPSYPKAEKPVGLSIPPELSDNLPMTNVSFLDAILFCNWLSQQERRTPCYERIADAANAWVCRFDADGYRMPDRVEYEYATRAGSATQYIVGPRSLYTTDYAHVAADIPEPVGSRCPNGWGMFDLIGNVWELVWCLQPNEAPPPIDPSTEVAGAGRPMIKGSAARGGTFQTSLSHYYVLRPEVRGDYGLHVVCGEGRLSERRGRLFEELIRTGDPGLAVCLIRAAASGGSDIGAMIARLEEAARREPGSTRVRVGLGALLVATGRPAEAIGPLREAVLLQPDLPDTQRALAEAYERVGNVRQALAAYRTLIRHGEARDSDFQDLWRIVGRAGRDDDLIGLAADLEAVAGPSQGLALTCNDAAWMLVRRPGASSEVIGLAVRLARKAAALVRGEPSGTILNTLALALYRSGDSPGAINHAEQSIRLLGDRYFAENGFVLALARWQLGERESALMAYDRSVAWMDRYAPDRKDLVSLRAEAEALLDTSRPRPDFRSTMGDLNPLNPEAIFQRVSSNAAIERWNNMARDLELAIKAGRRSFESIGQSDYYSTAWLHLATLRLHLGDEPGYRRLCRRMIAEFARSEVMNDLDKTSKAGLLRAPDSLGEANQLRDLAWSALRRSKPMDESRPWYLLAAGLGDYRTGRPRLALRTMDSCLASSSEPNITIPALAVQAMALHQLGRSSEAGARIGRARRLLRSSARTVEPYQWADRLIAQILLREAEAVVVYDPVFPADPFAP